MLRKKLSWHIAFPFLLLFIILLFLVGYYITSFQEEYHYELLNEELRSKTHLIQRSLSGHIIDLYLNRNNEALKLEMNEISAIVGNEITLIDKEGNIVYDSRSPEHGLDNQLDRPEVISAKNGNYGYDMREDIISREKNIYASLPLYYKSELIMILRTSINVHSIERVTGTMIWEIVLAGLLAFVMTFGISYLISGKVKRSVKELKSNVSELSEGKLRKKVYIQDISELQELGESINSMAASLDQKIRSITNNSNIRQAVLESMQEGVIAVDNNEKILLINKTAERMLGLTEAHDKTLQEVVRIPDIQKFFRSILDDKASKEEEIMLKDSVDKIYHLKGSVLYSSSGKQLGVLAVINDITELRHLDNLKRDFVANVSHELKTPITTIKGFIETLREGAIDDKIHSARFLEIMHRHADRLNIIVEDLLSLSRLEQKSAVKEIKYVKENISVIIKSVAEDFYIRAKEKNINIKIDISEDINAAMNPPLIEEALGNLVDNAIKYSSDNTSIIIKAEKNEYELILSVIDEGPGIAAFHIPRLFERFYRVDKARSRDVGGTGLGLAIVKHIAQVHGGIADVESKIGKGSVFRIKIPMGNNL